MCFVDKLAFIRRLLETEIVPSMLAAAIGFAAVIDVLTLAGSFGTFAAVGDRLEKLNNRPMSGLAKTVLGTLVAVLASLFPVIGWFLILPLLLLFAFGAAVMCLVPAIGRIGKR